MVPLIETKPDTIAKELERMYSEFQRYTEEYTLGFKQLESLDLWWKRYLSVAGIALGVSALYVLYYHRLWIVVFVLLIVYEVLARTHRRLQSQKISLVKASHIEAMEVLRGRAQFLWENQMIDDETLEKLLKIGAESHAMRE